MLICRYPLVTRCAMLACTLMVAACATSPPTSRLAAAQRRWATAPNDTKTSQEYHRTVADLVKWYDGIPLEERAARCEAIGLQVKQEPTRESGLRHFQIASSIKVPKLDHCHDRKGVGVPVLAWRENDGSGKFDQFRPPEGIYAPMTAVLERHAKDQWTLQFHASEFRDTVRLEGRVYPLAANFSAAVATLVNHAEALRKSGRSGMLDSAASRRREKLYLIQPYDPNKIPVLMVHGLQSTPVAFGNLVNDLLAERWFRERYQIWHYHYPTGTPVLQNAMTFRKVLRETLHEIDPEGDDYASNHIVAMGHSMGGVLCHTLTCDSGYKLWDAVIRVRPSQLTDVPEWAREAIESVMIFRRETRVKRAIFIAAPHRGSAYADNWIGNLGQSLFRQDQITLDVFRPLLKSHRADVDPFLVQLLDEGKLSSIRTLSAKSPALQALATIPPAVPFHSIIGQKKPGLRWQGSDGIVSYASSHLEGAESELIVPYGHNAFRHEMAVKEIKRILLRNLGSQRPPVNGHQERPKAPVLGSLFR